MIELFNDVIVVLWTWLPDQLGVDPSSFFYLAAVLGVGGVLVGLGQRYLGYHPRPLEQVRGDVERGVAVDTRTIPRTLGNSVASLGFGAPLGPEAALVAVVGGTFAWATRYTEDFALRTYGLLRGWPEDDAARARRYAPAAVAVVVLVIVFRALPGGVDLTFVPRSVDPGSPSAPAQALIAGAVGACSASSRARSRPDA